MVSKEDNKYVIWASYFDRDLSRSEGRRVPKDLAVENPDVDRIFKVAKELGLNPVVERDSRYPSDQWRYRGRVLVDKVKRKRDILLDISSRLRSS